MAERVREVYASALFDAAASDEERQELLAQAQELRALLGSMPDYTRLMATPAVPKEEKLELLEKAFSGQVHPKLLNLLRVLVNNGRFPYFSEIAEEFQQLLDEHRGVLAVTAVTAMPLSGETTRRLEEKLRADTGRDVRLKVEVDPSVLGGLLLRYGGKEIDGTIRTRLDGMRQRILGSAIH